MKGFTEFIRKGNLVQLAVAFVMGVAFAAVVTSFVTNMVSPLLGLIGGVDLTQEGTCVSGVCDVTVDTVTGAVSGGDGVFLAWGAFLTAVITFLVTAVVIYFVVVKPYEHLEARLVKPEDAPTGPSEVELLTQIRDSIQAQAGTTTAGATVGKPS